ncbi:MAG TPA: Wzz/FepE/Etk N-terminal domain-containing protein [Gaiellaceae bacterium]|jgi:capsular polysaccharide biosynthesis protein|nr:Wzz/FepE/Etk N-terminal domain-containing protein [Gaiellaceae bacterium]
MTTPRQSPDLDAEREVDLGRWKDALLRRWWLVALGLVVGAIVGLIVSFSGGSTFKASALISLGQPVSPGGTIIQSFATNPRAVSDIVSAASAQQAAEQAAGMRSGALRGHVSVATVGTTPGTTAARSSTLISLSVQNPNKDKAAAAANALANLVVTKTTAPYVSKKIDTYTSELGTVDKQLRSISLRVAQLNQVVNTQKLDPFNKLVLVSQLDNAVQRQGNLYNQQATLDQQLAFSKEVESAKVITTAKGVKSTARTTSTSLIVGAVVGLILGAIAAIVSDGRRRPAAAPV